MALLYSIGGSLVTTGEMHELGRSGRLRRFKADAIDDRHAALELSGGRKVGAEFLLRTFIAPDGTPNKYTPIGLGKPLTMSIRHIYTGECPTFVFSTADLLGTSAMKPADRFKGAPRAVNLLRKGARKNADVTFVAPEDGSPLIYYSPAITDQESFLTVELITHSFPDEAFAQVGSAVGQAAGIPIFASESLYLLAGSVLIKLIGSLGEAIFDGSPFLQATERISFGEPGLADGVAGQVLLVNDEDRSKIESQYELNAAGALVTKGSAAAQYSGPIPYVTLTLDGAERSGYKGFQPTAASIVLLDRFFHISETTEKQAGELITAVNLANDLTYSKSAAAQAQIMANEKDHNSDRYKNAQQLYDAYVKNLQTDEFKKLITLDGHR